MLATTLAEKDGGIARSVPRLAKALVDNGVPVRLIYPHSRTPAVPLDALDGVELLPAYGWRDLCRVIAANLKGERNRLIAYHAGVWSPANHFFAKAARNCGVPYVSSPRSMMDPWALGHRRLKKTLAWHLYARSDLSHSCFIHATSELERGHIERLGVSQPVRVIPNGVEPPMPQGKALKKGRGKRLLFLSRLHPKKGIEDLLAAFAACDRRDWELVIVGAGEKSYERSLHKRASRIPADLSVSFVGAVSDKEKWSWLRSADVVVLPSYSENFGLVVAEALAVGVPVITTKATPWMELHERNCGWCIDLGAASLESTLKEVFQSRRDNLAEAGRLGREWVRREFDWPRVAGLFYRYCLEALP